ncbi:hypothetical protein J6590_066867 [Homalodisca vitripennis]|nr:hypothetical protein J6590_066867 [Homalodisca vitripennis]
MTKPLEDRISNERNLTMQENPSGISKTPDKNIHQDNVTSPQSSSSSKSPTKIDDKHNKILRKKWTEEEKSTIYHEFGKQIIRNQTVPRNDITELVANIKGVFKSRSTDSIITFVNNKILRKQ